MRLISACRPPDRAEVKMLSGVQIMRAGLAFCTGVAAFHLMRVMPPSWIGMAIALPVAVLAWRIAWLRLPFFSLLGALWAQIHACTLLCAPFPDDLARVPLVIEGRIASIPAHAGDSTRFLFQVERTLLKGDFLPFDGLIRLSWYDDAPELMTGERWRLPVRLKPRHGYANPGGFDFERWLFEQGVQATGHVHHGDELTRLDRGPGPYWLDRWRQGLANHLARVLGDTSTVGLVQALAIGETSGFPRDDWDVLALTGTTHLVAISGMNVWMIAGIALVTVRWLWSRSIRLTLFLAAPRAAALAGIIAAFGYSGLAGFSVSTQRALVMLAVVLAALVWQRTLRPYHALSMALVGVLVVDPHAVLSFGFWLSFVAVGVLIFNLGHRLPSKDLWTRWGRAQWAVTLGLLPLVLFLFGRISLIAPLVNLVAVPLFTLILLPLVLVASLLSLIPGGEWPLILSAALLGWCMDGLTWFAALPLASVSPSAPPHWAWAVSAVGVLLLLAPRGLPGRWVGLVMVMPLFVARQAGPAPGDAWLTLLDVGQGLAAVIQTSDGNLVFDTGPSYPGGFDTGRAVVAPFLIERGVRRLERLIVSHADRDHAGGSRGLAERVAIGRIQSGEPDELPLPDAEPCLSGDNWVWSGVSFLILYPDDSGEHGNRASCVLRIEAGGRSILLTGDADQRVERMLVDRYGSRLRSDILIAGHHGSASSTSLAFLRAVAPGWVLFSSGYANQFGFPAREVRERVAGLGMRTLDTGVDGAIHVRLGADGTIDGPRGWRQQAGRLWTHRPCIGCESGGFRESR
jgi:competence protein ComEC